jgi:hypothetical protein
MNLSLNKPEKVLAAIGFIEGLKEGTRREVQTLEKVSNFLREVIEKKPRRGK